MNVVIIEDEAPAAARLKKMLAATASGIEVLAVLDTLAGATAWLRSNPAPDLIFMDIQLSDGLSLLKPVKQERLEAALRKLDEIKEYFMARYMGLVEKQPIKGKFLVRRGTEFVSIRVEEIAFFYASHKLVCLVRKDGAKFILDQSLAEIEKQVESATWFRLNRKYLMSAAAIRKVSALPKSKLLVEVEPAAKEELVVSSENSAAFKTWFGR
jgi:DNA-binding LytR/AlgR family response regulator